jgi:hypothetical protein
MVDLFNKAYFTKRFPNIFPITGIQLMPIEANGNDYIDRIINVTGSTFYPLAIFIFSLALGILFYYHYLCILLY